MKREFKWVDAKHQMKIICYGKNNYDVCRWDEEKKEWEYLDARHDWSGEMLLDGLGMLIDFLKLGEEEK